MVENKPVKKYDLIVIGSGPAGEKGAAQAAYFGKKVAMVEKDFHLGGAAAGTAIPNKTLRETSLALSAIRSRHLYGVDLSLKRRTTVQDFLHHERIVKDAERKRVKNNMQLHKIDIYKGVGSFLDKKTIKVEVRGKKPIFLNGEIILIATGSRPRRPDNFPKNPRIYDSDSILQIKRLPKNMVVIGGGVIGLEYACTFAVLGVDVSVVHNRDILLPFLDRDISFALENSISKIGIDLFKSDSVESCNIRQNRLELKLGSGNTINTEAIMLATGRSSNTEELNLNAAGIITGKYGRLVVDNNYQVIHPETKKNVSDIYAVGDVIGPPSLASTSMEQARFAMIKAFNLEPYKEHVAPILPLGIYTIPECSMAGKTEEQCQEEEIDYVLGKASYNKNARGMIIGDNEGFLKLIFEFNRDLSKPMKLLGVHVIGEIASELIHFGVSALIMNAGSDLFINTCFNYPTLGELYKYATYQAMGNRAKRLKDE
ncbi:MAG: pyridine nucleotide-disulfide oxidoreductase [Thermoplasmatales archaeon SG8-52-3]|nr:MAG: pyridine nucleotide-disulfide oxidoreductase [Thermoplasmatales archaeon SG8-52-3]